MSPTKRTSTTKPTSKKGSFAWLTTWADTPGVRHHALAKVRRNDWAFVDVFTPCLAYVKDAYDNTDNDGTVTCLPCLHSAFAEQCKRMNLEAIKRLSESDLLDHFIDRDAMAITYEY